MSFDSSKFAIRLLAESLFYDEEYGVLGNVGLIDTKINQEQYLATYEPSEGVYVIEKAIEWESPDADREEEIGYALATDGKDLGTYQTAKETATVLYELATQENLEPSMVLLFESEEDI